jgi:hypothetical protein
MADYEHKPGSFNLLKNTKKEGEKDSDYWGDGKLPDGTDVWVNAWLKKSKAGNTYMACSIRPKVAVTPREPTPPVDDDLSDVPF